MFKKSVNRYDLTFFVALIFLISMAIPGTYTYRASRGAEAYAVISASYIFGSWNPMTWITFGLAAVGFGGAWLGKRLQKPWLLLFAAVLAAAAVCLMFTMCATVDMMLDFPLMLVPPVLGSLTALLSLTALVKR